MSQLAPEDKHLTPLQMNSRIQRLEKRPPSAVVGPATLAQGDQKCPGAFIRLGKKLVKNYSPKYVKLTC